MKILWLVNIMMPQAAAAFGFSALPQGGWIEGQLSRLDTRSHQMVICCCSDSAPAYEGQCEVNGVRYISVSCSVEKQETRFRALLAAEQPDVVHVFGTEYPHCLSMMRAADPARTVISIQGLVTACGDVYGSALPPDRLLSHQLPRFLLPRFHLRTVQEGKEAFLHQGKAERESLRLARYVMGRTHWDRALTELFNPAAQYFYCGELLRSCFYEGSRWSYDQCRPHTIFISQASYPIKGFHQFLRALPLILERYPDTQVRVGGFWENYQDAPSSLLHRRYRDEYQDYLCQLIAGTPLASHIQFLGNLNAEAMRAEFLQANVFVSCSVLENSSNSVCEAQLLGTPVVSSNVGGTSDLIEDGKTGFLYPFHEIHMLAYYVCHVFEKQNSIQELSDAAIAAARKRHDPAQVTQTLMSIYQTIMEKAVR